MPTRMVFGADDIHIPPASVAGGERHGDNFQMEFVTGGEPSWPRIALRS